jgi:hypothetical protein
MNKKLAEPVPLNGSELLVRLGLREAHHFLARFELAPLFQNLDALKALENVAFGDDGAGAFK